VLVPPTQSPFKRVLIPDSHVIIKSKIIPMADRAGQVIPTATKELRPHLLTAAAKPSIDAAIGAAAEEVMLEEITSDSEPEV
jgi:hypothetical protein